MFWAAPFPPSSLSIFRFTSLILFFFFQVAYLFILIVVVFYYHSFICSLISLFLLNNYSVILVFIFSLDVFLLTRVLFVFEFIICVYFFMFDLFRW